MTFEERIAELESALEAERAYSKMRDMSYESDVEREIHKAEERGFMRGIQEAGTQAETKNEFKRQIERELQEKVPEMLKAAIPDEYKDVVRNSIRPRIRVDQYDRPEDSVTVTNAIVDIPHTRIMLNKHMCNEMFTRR